MSYEETSLEEKSKMYKRVQLPKILGSITHILCSRLDQPRLKLTVIWSVLDDSAKDMKVCLSSMHALYKHCHV